MTQSQAKPKTWPRILLVFSLALNLIVVGIIAGAFMRGGAPNAGPRFDLTAGPLTRAMDEENRDAVRAALRENDVFRRQDRSAMRADMQALIATLRADNFDAEMFKNVLSRQRLRLQAGQDTVVSVVSEQIQNMTITERAAFADRLEEQVRRGPPHSRDRD